MPLWYQHPPLLLALLLLVVGFVLLSRGADVLVDGAVALARRFSLSPALIGVTVVAFGTSLPELVVSLGANLKAVWAGESGVDGPAAIALANIIDSNIFNIGIILGVIVLIKPLAVPPNTFRTDYPFLVLSLLLVVLASLPNADGQMVIVRWQGLVMLAALIWFLIMAVRKGRITAEEATVPDSAAIGTARSWFLVMTGIVLLSLGGELCLVGAVGLARGLGMGERVIGLTVVAFGTSLPELVTGVQAARRGEAGIAIGNIIGSCLFNVLGVIALVAVIVPVPVHPGNLQWDYWWLGGLTLLLLPLMWTGRVLVRWEGGVLLVVSLLYMGLLLI